MVSSSAAFLRQFRLLFPARRTTATFALSRTAFTTDAGCFREFGGEEWYIHEKYRQAGAKCLCLPFLRWQHRFADPAAGRREDRAHPDEDGRRLRLDVARVPTLGEPGDHRNRDLHAELLGVVMDGERQALLEREDVLERCRSLIDLIQMNGMTTGLNWSGRATH